MDVHYPFSVHNQTFNISVARETAPIASMDWPEEFSSSVPESEDATDFWDGVIVEIQKVLFTTDARYGHVHGTAAQDVAADTRIHRFDFEELLAHRRDRTCDTLFEIRVRWEGNDETWEPELNIQKDAPLALFAYWKCLKGGREGAMMDNGLWHPFNVVSHRIDHAGSVYLKVAWVGSPKKSWEPETKIQEADEKLVKSYWVSVGGRAGAIKRPTDVKSSVRKNKSCKMTHLRCHMEPF